MQQILELVSEDNRSGKRLEFVFPVRNEESRGDVLKYYAQFGDIVLLDDQSDDRTHEITLKLKGTIYKRIDPDISEKHFVHYINNLSKSKKAVLVFVDEFISEENIKLMEETLANKKTVVWGERVDYMYGERLRGFESYSPRGFFAGSAKYDPFRQHAALQVSDLSLEKITIPIYHLQLYDLIDTFGKSGAYTRREVKKILSSKHPVWFFIKRFVLSKIRFLLSGKWLRNGRRGIFYLFSSMVDTLVGILTLMEIKWFPSKEAQHKDFVEWFGEEID